jgi:uncharacterized membrane protein
MSLVLNPSTMVQNGAAMIAALSCVECIREIPIYYAGDGSNYNLLIIKLTIAVIVVVGLLIMMFILQRDHSASLSVPS